MNWLGENYTMRMRHWWENLGPNGLPRFYVFLAPVTRFSQNFRHIDVVQITATATELPRNHKSPYVNTVLLHTKPLYVGDEFSRGARVFAKAERVVERLNSMPLSLMALENEEDGLQKLFRKLWDED